MGMDRPPEGVTFLDHTADVALEVEAPSREELFRRAAAGTRILLLGEGREAAGGPETRAMVLEAEDLAGLLRSWLRELIWLQQDEGMSFVSSEFTHLTSCVLEARVTVASPGSPPIREIKGVTLHRLRARREGGVWRARVVFDV